MLAALFVLLRLPVIMTSMNRVFDLNELHIGTIAKESIEGRSLPLFDYQLSPIKAGTLVEGIFVVPFFLLFGQSLYVLKLVALFVSLTILAATYFFLLRFFNKKIAVITGLLMAVSPPIYTLFSLMAYGRTYESILFTMAALSLFYRIFFQEDPVSDAPGKERYFAFFGLVSGFGLYFDYIFAVTLVYCLGFWFIFDKAFFTKRTFRVFLAFFLLGLTPWIYYNLTHHFAAVSIDDDYPGVPLRRLFFLNSLPEVARKFKELLFYHLPRSFYFGDLTSIPGDVISYAYYSVFLSAFCFLFWMNRDAAWKLIRGFIPSRKSRVLAGPRYRESFIMLYPVAFSLLSSFSCYLISKKSEYNFFGFREYRFLIILYPFIFIIVAIFLSRLWDWAGRGRRIARLLCACISFILIASGLSADYSLVTPGNFGRRFVYQGYNYEFLGTVIGERGWAPLAKAVNAAGGIRQPYRAAVFKGIGWNIAWRFFRGKEYADMDTCMMRLNGIDPGYRPFALEGFGAFLELQFRDNTAAAVSCVNSIGEHDRPYVYRGIGWFIGLRFKENPALGIKKIERIDEAYWPDCYRGLGEIVGLAFGQNMDRCAEVLRGVPLKYRPYVFEGLTGNT
jgi:hypothetical protein